MSPENDPQGEHDFFSFEPAPTPPFGGAFHSAADAVAQLKSYWELNTFMTTAPRTQMICNSGLVEKTLLNSVMRCSAF
jgi:hypothetical protein